MVAPASKQPEPPLGIIASLAAGFETVNARWELALLPLALDLFLWLGPHLSIRNLVLNLVGVLRAPPDTDANTLRGLALLREGLTVYAARFNLFSALSTTPILNTLFLWLLAQLGLDPQKLGQAQNSVLAVIPTGLPSLMAGRAPVVLPPGAAVVWPVTDGLQYVLLLGALIIVGLFLAALYFGGIAQQVRDARLNLRRLFQQVWGDWARLTAYCALLLLALLAMGVPALVVTGFAALMNPLVGSLISAVTTLTMVWVMFYLGFALPGMVLQRRGLFGAVWDSLRLVRGNLPQTTLLYFLIMAISLGLGAVWNLPPDDSWFLLVGVVGHAVVSTALVAATFVFYKDRYRWWLEARQHAAAPRPAPAGNSHRSPRP
jgi:hypothetical protein